MLLKQRNFEHTFLASLTCLCLERVLRVQSDPVRSCTRLYDKHTSDGLKTLQVFHSRLISSSARVVSKC